MTQPLPLTPNERLIFALDVENGKQAIQWVDKLSDTVSFYKIGMELLASGEYFQVLDTLAQRNKRVFVDLKFFDIPATVAAMVKQLSRWPISYCTVHGWHAPMMQAAAEANQSNMQLLAVTVLTSMNQTDLNTLGIQQPAEQIVVERALAAQTAGLHGVIASGLEARPIRNATGDNFSIVCPGIRPQGPTGDDQQRTVNVTQAFANGATAIVVGRPIRQAQDPVATASTIQNEIRNSLLIR